MKCAGIDIGGTFTDLALWDSDTGELVIHKRPSTPDDPSRAGLSGLHELCERAGVTVGDIEILSHGTTVATNILLEKNGAKTGLITTRGFRDILHIGRKNRPYNFSHYQDVPRQSEPLVRRQHRKTVSERVTAPDGRIEVELDENEVRTAVSELAAAGVESIAVCCLHSYLNPTHEARIREIVEQECPGLFLSVSHEIAPLYREYERFSTTALNAYVGPKSADYIDRFAEGLRAAGCPSELHLMTSSGGVVGAVGARNSPVSLLLSGPVGALVAGIEIGKQAGYENVITLDVGGTSADIGVAPKGELRFKHLLDTKVGDYDAMVPMVEIDTIGAGGGSIAYLDDGDMFRVGPQSAGAAPGPVCYGKGGTDPTVTDAIVALGWYRPKALEKSGLTIAPEGATAAITRAIADPLGISLKDAAGGIHQIVTNHMVEAIRVNSVAKGFDPRDFALVAYGGAGAAFAVEVARDLNIPTVIVPPRAGVGAATGLLMTDLKYEYMATHWVDLNDPDLPKIAEAYARLKEKALDQLKFDGFSGDQSRFRYAVDCRYEGQGYELTLETAAPPINEQWVQEVIAQFHKLHRQTYLRNFEDRPVRMVNIRLSAICDVEKLHPKKIQTGGAQASEQALLATDDCLFSHNGEIIALKTSFISRALLVAGNEVSGPAVIEQSDTTTILPPGATAKVDDIGNLVIDPGSGS